MPADCALPGKRRRGGWPTRQEIAEAQAALLVDLPSLAGKDPASTCWACGWEEQPERAHVLARVHGGNNAPGNFLLLCGLCHDEQPDGAPRDAQIEWMRRRESCKARRQQEVRVYMDAIEAEADRLDARDLIDGVFAGCIAGTGGLRALFDEADARAARANHAGLVANRIAYLLELLRALVAARNVGRQSPLPG